MTNLACVNAPLRDQILAAMARVLDSGVYVDGPEVAAFEQSFAHFVGLPHAVGVASGSDALAVALRALGVGAGDEVITVAHTAVATVAAVERVGASPVLVDIDPITYTMDPVAAERAVTPRTRAILPVHLYGQPADLTALAQLSARHALRLVEDCCQAHGAAHAGRRVGSFGDAACFSFYPTKNLGGLGNGGMVVTPRAEVAEGCRMLRQHGWRERFVSERPGWNARLDELQAAVLRLKLGDLDAANARRRARARALDSALHHLPLRRPPHTEGHVYHQYVVASNERDALRRHLGAHGIATQIHYPVPVHLQPAYAGRLRCHELAATEQAARTVLSLPMTSHQTASIAAAVASFWRRELATGSMDKPADPPQTGQSGSP
jgi:dTDP-4-amino-4,6-dideoxygalactose transaminase